MKKIALILATFSLVSFIGTTVRKRTPQIHALSKSSLTQIDKQLLGKWKYQFSFRSDSIWRLPREFLRPYEMTFFYRSDSIENFKNADNNCEPEPKLPFGTNKLSKHDLLVNQDKVILVPTLLTKDNDSNWVLLNYCGFAKFLMDQVVTLNKDTLLLQTDGLPPTTHYYLRTK